MKKKKEKPLFKKLLIWFLLTIIFTIFAFCFIWFGIIGLSSISPRFKGFNSLKLKIILSIAFNIFTVWTFSYRKIRKILKKKQRNSIIKNLDASIEGISTNRWLHNEQNSTPNKVESSLDEFHHVYNCDSNSCKFHNSKEKDKAKQENKLKPGWVISTQYRDKKSNVLVRPPIKKDYFKYDEKTHTNILDSDEFKKAENEWLESLKSENNELVYHTMSGLHTIAVGATGSGKTQKIIFPGIIRNGVNLEEKNKPTMVITDPKGEIYKATSGILNENGYIIKVLNLNDTTISSSWNPLAIAWNFRNEAINFKERNCQTKVFKDLEIAIDFLKKGTCDIKVGNFKYICFEHGVELCQDKQCKKVLDKKMICISHEVEHCLNCIIIKKVICKDHNINDCAICIEEFEKKLDNSNYHEGKEIIVNLVDGAFYPDTDTFNRFVESQITRLNGLSEKELNTLASAIIVDNGNDPFWANASRDLFIGVSSIMLELMEIKPDKYPLEKFNIPSVLKIISEPQEKLKKWVEEYRKLRFEKLGTSSFASEKLSSYINSPETTAGSILSSLTVSIQAYSYGFVQPLLCDTKYMINLEEICYGSKPYAIYLIIPDSEKTFHPLASAFVNQLYKTGVQTAGKIGKANPANGETLTRQIQFYLDEFGNMPKIEDFDAMITVARSRNIFFMIILQDYTQLEATYGKEIAKTIKSNCNGSIYIKTNDSETAEIISKEYGTINVLEYEIDNEFKIFESYEEYERGKDNKDKKIEKAKKGVPVERDLISANDLMNLEMAWLTVKSSSTNPVLLHALYSYQMPIYKEYLEKPNAPSNNVSIDFDKNHFINYLSSKPDEWFQEDKEELDEIIDNENKIDASSLGLSEEEMLNHTVLSSAEQWKEVGKELDKQAQERYGIEKKQYDRYTDKRIKELFEERKRRFPNDGTDDFQNKKAYIDKKRQENFEDYTHYHNIFDYINKKEDKNDKFGQILQGKIPNKFFFKGNSLKNVKKNKVNFKG